MLPFGKRPGTLVRQESPFNAGPPPGALAAEALTPNDLFFVRNHGEVPVVDAAVWRLAVRGAVERELSLSLADLERFPRRALMATLQCAGNRRAELAALRPIPNELPWGFEAISTATWSGVALADVLAAARPTAEARHAAFEGLDETERHGRRFRFGGSIPLERATEPGVLLATAMNGEPLPPVHGAPLRVVVPGWFGARSVKWLSAIELRATPSDNYFQAVAYRLFPAGVGPENVVWEEGAMLGELPVNSIVLAPLAGARLAAGSVAVAGVALAGGDRGIARVEITADGGRNWTQAVLEPGAGRHVWRRWWATLELPPGRHEIAARAFDSAAQTQPADVADVWNFKGYANNAWHRVRVDVG
jgi:sulfite oxidase